VEEEEFSRGGAGVGGGVHWTDHHFWEVLKCLGYIICCGAYCAWWNLKGQVKL